VDAGLISAEADARRAKMGPNAFTAVRKASKAQQVLRQYADPMQIVLVAPRMPRSGTAWTWRS